MSHVDKASELIFPDRPRVLLIGQGGFVPSTIGLAHGLHKDMAADWRQLVLLGAETFDFRPRPSTILVEGIPAGVIACAPSLEEWGIASRLASPAGLPGCFDGDVNDLAIQWLEAMPAAVLAELQIVGVSQPGIEAIAEKFGVVCMGIATTPSDVGINRS